MMNNENEKKKLIEKRNKKLELTHQIYGFDHEFKITLLKVN
jgi:hypothetical protein